jgi:hypothetical protein
MPFSTTAEFRTAVKSWSKRSELSDAEIDDFTRLFEAEFFGDPEIRFLELRSIQVISSPSYPLKLITPQSAAEAYNYATAANGLSYLIEGNNLRIEPLPAPITLRIGYFAALTTITGGSANWLLTNWPNAYLFGTLRYTAPYIGNDERIPMWEEWYQRTRALIIAADRKARRSGSQPGMRLRSTP